MAFVMVKLWLSKLKHTKRQVLDRCLAILSRVLSFPKKQETKEKNPSCSEGTLDVVVVVHPTSSAIMEDVEGVIRAKQERGRESPSCIEITPAVELPEDLLVEILHRLSLKSLVRLKSVSKEWKSMMESGYLAEKHLIFIERKNGFEEMKIAVEWSTSRSLCIKFFSKRSGMESASRRKLDPRHVAGSCNGLVCFYDFDVDSGNIYLFNPMTGVNRTLTPPRGGTIRSVGFGIDIVTGKYKVVLLYGLKRVLETVVLDLNTSNWRQRYKTTGDDPVSLSCIPRRERNPICVNGSLFWLLANNYSEILAMNLHTEKFRFVSLLNEMDMSPDRIYMWSFEDRLYVSNLRERSDSYVWVLVQNELSDKWERTKFEFLRIYPPLPVNSSWFSQTLVSPYQPSSSIRTGSRQKLTSRTRSSAVFSENGDTSDLDAPTELRVFLHR